MFSVCFLYGHIESVLDKQTRVTSIPEAEWLETTVLLLPSLTFCWLQWTTVLSDRYLHIEPMVMMLPIEPMESFFSC